MEHNNIFNDTIDSYNKFSLKYSGNRSGKNRQIIKRVEVNQKSLQRTPNF
jgi:hypothetical protein